MARGHEIVITPRDLHVEVRVDGHKVAESDRPVLLAETGLPTRYYLPREDVRSDLLRRTAHTSTCPFKGRASYWTLEVGGQVYDNLAWTYEDPIRGAEGIGVGQYVQAEIGAWRGYPRDVVSHRSQQSRHQLLELVRVHGEQVAADL